MYEKVNKPNGAPATTRHKSAATATATARPLPPGRRRCSNRAPGRAKPIKAKRSSPTVHLNWLRPFSINLLTSSTGGPCPDAFTDASVETGAGKTGQDSRPPSWMALRSSAKSTFRVAQLRGSFCTKCMLTRCVNDVRTCRRATCAGRSARSKATKAWKEDGLWGSGTILASDTDSKACNRASTSAISTHWPFSLVSMSPRPRKTKPPGTTRTKSPVVKNLLSPTVAKGDSSGDGEAELPEPGPMSR
mmetsp:Transcript_77901/g.252587  ORF Transcript_77901/g.252587 Transcript_77901/m.252587 type:complete len:247 (-) Transcript_77901:1266-2006(-)